MSEPPNKLKPFFKPIGGKPPLQRSKIPQVIIDQELIDKLFSLASSFDLGGIEEFFLSNVLPLTVTKDDDTIVHTILKSRNITDEDEVVRILKFLISRGAPINAKDKSDMSPLHIAIKRLMPKVVKFLLENGARTDMTNSQQLTPMHLACMTYLDTCDKDVHPETLIPPPKLPRKDISKIHMEIRKEILEMLKKQKAADNSPTTITSTSPSIPTTNLLNEINKFDKIIEDKEVEKFIDTTFTNAFTNEGLYYKVTEIIDKKVKDILENDKTDVKNKSIIMDIYNNVYKELETLIKPFLDANELEKIKQDKKEDEKSKLIELIKKKINLFNSSILDIDNFVRTKITDAYKELERSIIWTFLGFYILEKYKYLTKANITDFTFFQDETNNNNKYENYDKIINNLTFNINNIGTYFNNYLLKGDIKKDDFINKKYVDIYREDRDESIYNLLRTMTIPIFTNQGYDKSKYEKTLHILDNNGILNGSINLPLNNDKYLSKEKAEKSIYVLLFNNNTVPYNNTPPQLTSIPNQIIDFKDGKNNYINKPFYYTYNNKPVSIPDATLLPDNIGSSTIISLPLIINDKIPGKIIKDLDTNSNKYIYLYYRSNGTSYEKHFYVPYALDQTYFNDSNITTNPSILVIKDPTGLLGIRNESLNTDIFNYAIWNNTLDNKYYLVKIKENDTPIQLPKLDLTYYLFNDIDTSNKLYFKINRDPINNNDNNDNYIKTILFRSYLDLLSGNSLPELLKDDFTNIKEIYLNLVKLATFANLSWNRLLYIHQKEYDNLYPADYNTIINTSSYIFEDESDPNYKRDSEYEKTIKNHIIKMHDNATRELKSSIDTLKGKLETLQNAINDLVSLFNNYNVLNLDGNGSTTIDYLYQPNIVSYNNLMDWYNTDKKLSGYDIFSGYNNNNNFLIEAYKNESNINKNFILQTLPPFVNDTNDKYNIILFNITEAAAADADAADLININDSYGGSINSKNNRKYRFKVVKNNMIGGAIDNKSDLKDIIKELTDLNINLQINSFNKNEITLDKKSISQLVYPEALKYIKYDIINNNIVDELLKKIEFTDIIKGNEEIKKNIVKQGLADFVNQYFKSKLEEAIKKYIINRITDKYKGDITIPATFLNQSELLTNIDFAGGYSSYLDALGREMLGFELSKAVVPNMKVNKGYYLENDKFKKDNKDFNLYINGNYFEEDNLTTLQCYTKKNTNILDVLLDYNNKLNIGDFRGWTPIYYAIEGRNYDIINKLLDKNKRIDLLYLNYQEISPIRLCLEKEISHLKNILNENVLYFNQRYNKLMMDELLASKNIKHNIPVHIDLIFLMAIILQNRYWSYNIKKFTDITDNDEKVDSENDLISESKTNTKHLLKQYEQLTDNIYNDDDKKEGKSRDKNTQVFEPIKESLTKIDNNNDDEKNGYLDSIIKYYRTKAKKLNNDGIGYYGTYWNHNIKDNIFKNINSYVILKIINEQKQILQKILDSESKKKIGINERASYTITDDQMNSLNIIKSNLALIITFINLRFNDIQTLDENIYNNFLVKMYTHILANILGVNLYLSIEKLILVELVKSSKIFNENLTDATSEEKKVENLKTKIFEYLNNLRKRVINDKLEKGNINYEFIMKSLGLQKNSDEKPDPDYITPDSIIGSLRDELREILTDKNDLIDKFDNYLYPYYKDLYTITLKYLHMMTTNYHKFIINHYKGTEITIKLLEKIK